MVVVETSITSITLNKTSATLDLVGTKTLQLTATINPSSYTEGYTWSSSNSNVASVSSSGYVIGKTNGTATITIKSSSGKVSATCSIIVKTSVVVSNTKSSYKLPSGYYDTIVTGEEEVCEQGSCIEYEEVCEEDTWYSQLWCHMTNNCVEYGPDVCHMEDIEREVWEDGEVKISFNLNNSIATTKLKLEWSGSSSSVSIGTLKKTNSSYYFYLYNSSSSSVSGTVTLKYTDNGTTTSVYTWTIN